MAVILSFYRLWPFSLSLSTVLHRANLWHALAPSFPRPGLDDLLLISLSILLIRPIQLLLQVTSGASKASTLEELTGAKFGAENIEREALAAMLLLDDGALRIFVCIRVIHKLVKHRAKQSGHLMNLRLHL